MRLPDVLLALALATSTLYAQGVVQTLPAPAGVQYLGDKLAVDGDRAVMSGEGRVFLYTRQAGIWSFDQELLPPVPADGLSFGITLALDGDRLAVGATGYGDEGALLLYERVAGTWSLDQIIEYQPPFSGFHNYPIAVDLDGDRCVVSGSENTGSPEGFVELYERSAGTWTLADGFPIEMPNSISNNGFGRQVELEGQQLIVSGSRDQGGGYWDGFVFSYRESGGSWDLEQTLGTPGFSFPDGFGTYIDLDGDRLLATDSTAGAAGEAYVFRRTAGGWEQEGPRLRIPALVFNANFGRAGVLRGDTVAISAPSYGPGDAGTVFTFHRDGNVWRSTGAFEALDQDFYWFGRSLAFAGDQLLVARGDHDQSGTVSILALPTLATPYGTCATPDAPCANADVVAGCATSTGSGSILRVLGSTSVALDDLNFEVSGVPSGQFGLLYMGAAATNGAFGDGRRLVAGGASGLFRYPVRQADGQGSFEESGVVAFAANQFGASGAITAGSTWYFQGWFRDPSGPCGSGFNLTPGLKVRFQP